MFEHLPLIAHDMPDGIVLAQPHSLADRLETGQHRDGIETSRARLGNLVFGNGQYRAEAAPFEGEGKGYEGVEIPERSDRREDYLPHYKDT